MSPNYWTVYQLTILIAIFMLISTCVARGLPNLRQKRSTDDDGAAMHLSVKEMTNLKIDYVIWYSTQPKPVGQASSANFVLKWTQYQRFKNWRQEAVNGLDASRRIRTSAYIRYLRR